MNRQERLAVWRDETAHPGSPTTWAALEASGANMSLVDEWRDLVGDCDDWMPYMDWLEGAIGIAVEYMTDEYLETQAPSDWSKSLGYLQKLWDELSSVTGERYDSTGQSETEQKRYALSRQVEDRKYVAEKGARPAGEMTPLQLDTLAGVKKRLEIAERVQRENGPSALTESILQLPGTLYVRYDPATKQFLGFGFMPVNSSHPEFAHLDGPDPECDLTEYENPVWAGMREYLNNTDVISGEAAMYVVWTEDGWRVK